MKTRHKGAAAAVGAAPGETRSPRVALRDRLRALQQASRQVFGIPDYERYLAHMAAHHAGDPVLSRREFFAHSIDRKYGKSGPRCC
ncbi:MAG: YbdD/YjiX family protein [Betaproteobacteria bacterium]|nr:MAG: YbdD/YjiX family protein [Betaproteobacteria bacterium]